MATVLQWWGYTGRGRQHLFMRPSAFLPPRRVCDWAEIPAAEITGITGEKLERCRRCTERPSKEALKWTV